MFRMFNKVIHPTDLEIEVMHHVAGTSPTENKFSSRGFWNNFHVTSDKKIRESFYLIAIECGLTRENGLGTISSRETSIIVSGRIKGVEVVKQEVHSVNELADILNQHGCGLDHISEPRQIVAAKKEPVAAKETDTARRMSL